MAPAPYKAHFEVHAIAFLCLKALKAKYCCVIQGACEADLK